MDRTTKYHLGAVSGINIHSASICLLASALSSCLPAPPDGVGVSLKVHESGVENRPKNNKMAPCKKNKWGSEETRIVVFLCMFQIMMTLMLLHWQVVQNSTHTQRHTRANTKHNNRIFHSFKLTVFAQ